MKSTLPAFFILVLFFSCSEENLYDIKDLSTYDDFIYKVRVIPIDKNKPTDFTVAVNQTNGYDQNKSYPYSFGSGVLLYEFAVKGYKKTGVNVYPRDNIKAVLVELREVGFVDDIQMQFYSRNSKPISVGYNFETNEKLTKYIEED